jgi:hypothetical protein
LIELGSLSESADNSRFKVDQRAKIVEMDVKSDLCMTCRNSVEETCIRFNVMRWHSRCLTCHVCHREVATTFADASYDTIDNRVLCPLHAKSTSSKGFEKVTQLQQYIFLLRVALKRLYSLLKIKGSSLMRVCNNLSPVDDPTGISASQTVIETKVPSNELLATATSKDSINVDVTPTHQREISYDNEMSDSFGDMRSQHVLATSSSALPSQQELADESRRAQKAIEKFDRHESVHNLVETAGSGPQSPVLLQALHVARHNEAAASANRRSMIEASSGNKGAIFSAPSSSAQKEPTTMAGLLSPSSAVSSTSPVAISHDLDGQRRILYLAELSALEYFIVRHVAVLKMHPLVQEQYTMTELLDVIRNRKVSFWSRIFSTFKNNKKQVKQKGAGIFLMAQ